MSIHNVHDVSFLTNNFNTDGVWIGLTTNRADGWQWSDGTAVQYTNWAKGEPSSDDENCVEMYKTGEWNDARCGNSHCEYFFVR